MSGLPRFLEKITALLERSGIPYMITGSMGSVYHGEPRSSRDVDIVIAATRDSLDTFALLAHMDFYVSLEEMRNALENASLFNAVDLETGWKADLIIRKERPFSQGEFERRVPVDLHGFRLFVVSPEDAILSKLEWARETRSELQVRDALGVAIVQRGRLDLDYLRHWAAELGVSESLETILRKAEATA
ncbi:MAG: hypothetical protein ABIT01_03725 [Thermoanaerobaculia bacterium]